MGVDGVAQSRREIDTRYEIDSKVVLRLWGANRDSCYRFLLNFQAAIKFIIVSVRLILPKVRVDGFTRPRRESDVRCKFHVKLI